MNTITKAFAGVFFAVALIAPVQAHAELYDDLKAQINHLTGVVASLQEQLAHMREKTNAVTPAPSSSVTQTAEWTGMSSAHICLALKRTLYYGVRGDDVRELQEFLRSVGDYEYPEITGYFGLATEKAVQRYQARSGIVSSGTPYTTGYGVVGPKTSSAMRCLQKEVERTTPAYSENDCHPVVVPICADGFLERLGTDARGCNLGARCVPPGGNRAPVINSFSGPDTLRAGQLGTWTVDASDSENGTLKYTIDWGDKVLSTAFDRINALANTAFLESATFQHAYIRSGTFIVTVVVRDSAGVESKATRPVHVEGDETIISLSR
ncbi:MAG: peptidoglycan-binding protein [bacterium]|nr:peptidoglycan-binding protein [bacterium]